MPAFDVHDWCAWAPRMTGQVAWQRWAQEPGYTGEGEPGLPDVGFLAPMQRRRLGLLARMFFQVAQPLAGGEAMPVVFASRHGDTRQTMELLRAVATGDGMSPTAFGLSVHNATTGLWSIQTGQMTEMLATASEGDSLEHALLDACGLLQEGAAQVLVVCAEDQPARDYEPWVDDVPFPYAVALRVRPGARWRLDLVEGAAADSGALVTASPLNNLRRLLAGQAAWLSGREGRLWHWRQ
ncbi:MAG: hypothetical protein GAK30_00742 [Paracidovorax wautersii]|uniref:Beta-ketoacyl synthase-like N-terminal domain-containing protein n=1 Tax=Paracidovorax wautersii TaxID=1177982 RepID=A0A7V8FR59_9BURK|nr:MAG: hypothetical protein GAK30_00742 [Paracidovorax wautersii]